jgi:hypothetical protein
MAAPEPPQASGRQAPGRAGAEQDGGGTGSGAPGPVVQLPRYGRYVVLLVIAILVGITINTISTKPNGARGVAAGVRVPPFAVPLVTGNLKGDANVSTTGRAPACTVRGPRILNICQQYERGPVALVLFVDAGGCADVLDDLQALSPSYPRVHLAAVSIRGDRGSVRSLVASHGIGFPVGIDDQGDLAALYKLATCPQVTFIERGGVAQGDALLGRPSRATLRTRLAELEAGARQAGGRER